MSHDIETIGRKLRASGYRLTPQRQLILDAVCTLSGHVTAESVYEQVQHKTTALNLSTVYRNLQFLNERDILTVTHLGAGKLGYELAADDHHHHLQCEQCGQSIAVNHNALHDFCEQMVAQYDFQIDMPHITFTGRCSACRVDAQPSLKKEE